MLLYIYIQEATKIKIAVHAFKESYIVDGAVDVSSKHQNVLVYVRYK